MKYYSHEEKGKVFDQAVQDLKNGKAKKQVAIEISDQLPKYQLSSCTQIVTILESCIKDPGFWSKVISEKMK